MATFFYHSSIVFYHIKNKLLSPKVQNIEFS
nr:MAG TPA: hypothetical protein [Caudoviricetes sp.]